ncbi:hypothetical protein MKZ25_17455 [Solibacillus sp. FSL W7-1464]|uniref:hypothetical protein n=1 Tax=Solibacillus sp. FSL W7-1464 TaxID=2921706 RepID=UPI0030FCBFA2
MNFAEIKSVLEINGKESQVFLPNEIFDDLLDYLKSGTQVAYAYNYLYLTQFLYRNCKYFNIKALIDVKMIKQVLGYSESNRTMNFITKKGGLLDNIGYTESTKDFPLGWDFKKAEGEALSFSMASDMPKEMLPPIPKMFFLKKPLKAFERTILKQDKETNELVEEHIQGTFYDVSNTHSVDFDVFMYCMANEELGTVGFYLYSWLKHNNDIFGGYDVSYEKLCAETGLARTTMIQYLNALKAYFLVRFKFNQEYFVIGMTEGERMATTYYTNDYFCFNDEPEPFKKMMVMTNADYLQGKTSEIVVTMEQLPF